MKSIKLLVALLAAFMLVMPAFSMPNDDNQMKDGKMSFHKAVGEQNGKEGPAPMMGPANDKCDPKSMMDGKEQNRDRQFQEQ